MVLNFFGVGGSKPENRAGMIVANWLVEKVAVLKDIMTKGNESAIAGMLLGKQFLAIVHKLGDLQLRRSFMN